MGGHQRARRVEQLSYQKPQHDPHQLEQTDWSELSPEPALSALPDIMQLQRLIGNQSTQRLLAQQGRFTIQRFPGRVRLEERIGKPHTIGSGRYKKLLEAAEAYRMYGETPIAKSVSEIRDQFTKIAHMLDTIGSIIDEYKVDNNPSKKTLKILALETELNEERSAASNTLIRYLTDPPKQSAFVKQSSTISNAISTQKKYSNTVTIDPNTQGQTLQGGMKAVTEYQVGEQKGFFKEQQNTLYNPAPGKDIAEVGMVRDQQKQAELKNAKSDDERAAIEKKYTALKNEFELGVDLLGIDPNDARMNNRDVAMSLIDTLLEAHVIARAQFAIMNVPGAKKTGGFMESAKGDKTTEMFKKGKIATSNADKGNDASKISLENPNFLRLLSRLQLIDLLALQIDRGWQNYFIQYDNKGNVIGITGIDNDMALGKNVGTEQGKFDSGLKAAELPGISRFVDKELAQRIIKLDPSLLRLLLMNLLKPNELDALIIRLGILQAELQKSETKLLSPEQWQDHINAVINEKGSRNYAAALKYNVERTTK